MCTSLILRIIDCVWFGVRAGRQTGWVTGVVLSQVKYFLQVQICFPLRKAPSPL